MSQDHGTPAERLAAAVAKLQKNPLLAASGHAGALTLLVEYLGDLQRRVAGLEAALTEQQRRRADIERKCLQVLDHARALGQLPEGA